MKHLFVLAATVLALAGCSKKIEELPAPTQTGANTFGASIDGSLWAPQGFGIVPTAPLIEASFGGNNSYYINARNFSRSPTETEFEIYIENVTRAGTYYFNKTTQIRPSQSNSYAYYVERRSTPKHQWITDATHTGSVTITKLDIPNRIIAGTFEFTARDMTGGAAPIRVTDGRFDVKIQ
ncbi:hypothetical protein [Flaviaesturariibacter amylovorans]|uniref:Lipoprotein n=1 Tax=Flaviaesturariibacter amylovorans TaxID=1084520 RepID=A0ABP8HUE4_9BACT